LSNFNTGLRTGDASAAGATVRVMLVDDSAVIRGLTKRMVDAEPDMEVVASVGNGELAVKKLSQEEIDVILLDIEMPVMDGLTALPKLLEVDPKVKIVMASTLTLENAEISMRALRLGATDYIPKPTSTGAMGGASEFQRELVEKVRAFGMPRAKTRPGTAKPVAKAPAPAPAAAPSKSVSLRKPGFVGRPDLMAIGSSTGGPQALMEVLKGISAEVQCPIIVTQHMPATFTTILAQHLGKAANRPCAEAKDGDVLKPGHIFVAPGDYHMIVESRGVQKVLRLNQDPPENFCRPAVDPMLRSVAATVGSRALVVILTGMGADGAKGTEVVVNAGGTVIAQDEKTSVVWGMPGAAAAAGTCSAILPLGEMAGYINNFVLKGAA